MTHEDGLHRALPSWNQHQMLKAIDDRLCYHIICFQLVLVVAPWGPILFFLSSVLEIHLRVGLTRISSQLPVSDLGE